MKDLNEPLASALLRRLLPEYYQSDWAALLDLRQAIAHNVDPFRFVAQLFGLSEQEVYQRAAKSIGVAFIDKIPPLAADMLEADRVDQLRDVKSVRGRMLDRDLLFVAPDFWRFIELAKRVAYEPKLAAQLCFAPPKAIRESLVPQQSSALYQSAITRLAKVWPFASAHLSLPFWTRIIFLIIVLAVPIGFGLANQTFQPVITVLLAILFLVPAAFRLSCALGGKNIPRLQTGQLLGDKHLPTYTVLIPLRDEATLVDQLAKAMRALNYPAHKLDVKFVVEATSQKTISAVEPYLDDIGFELVRVPQSEPKTKPKAVNFALPFARGEHVVIYDAEDIPEPDQLRKAATLFARHPEIECLQAELVIDNANENWLTALFASEYAAQFGLIMPTLAFFNMPMPLGGTSNHFRTQTLKNIGAWDSFNVTEDADLGIRLSRRRLRSAILDSHTNEEAPINLWAWIKQRTRWMKGWMQTLLVHTKDFRGMSKQMHPVNLVVFYIYVGGLVFAAPLHGLFLTKLAIDIYQHQGIPLSHYLQYDVHFVVLISGYLSAFATACLGLWHTRQIHLLGWQALLPIYWLFTSFATLRAAFQLATKPFSWEKTEHARTQLPRFAHKDELKPTAYSTKVAKKYYL